MAATVNALRIITLYPVQRRYIYLEWAVDTAELGLGPFLFNLYRSGSPQGEWELIGENLDVFTYKDCLDLLHGMHKDIYYKVSTMIGGELVESEPKSFGTNLREPQKCMLQKIINDETTMLRVGNGIDVVILKKRHWGLRCPRCYNSQTGETMKSNCISCFGTTFAGGYFPPIKTMAKISPSTIALDTNAPTSIAEMDVAEVFMQAFPTVQRGDILVEPDVNKRWEITAVSPTQLLRNTVHQDLSMSRLSTAHPIYRVAIT